jgi:hypothetical protein
MADNISVRIRKKEYNSSTDNKEGVVVFDTITKTILVSGERFGSNVKSATYNNADKTLQITNINGSVISLNLIDDTSANEPTSLLGKLRDDINKNAISIATITGTGNGSITKVVNDAIGGLDSDVTIASNNNGVVTIKSSINENNGVISNDSASNITFSKIATSGNSKDISVTYNSTTTDVQTTISDINSRLVTLASRQIQYIEPSSNTTCPSGYLHYYGTNYSYRYIGNLTASASTMNRIYLCKTTSNGDYHQIMTVQSGTEYKWADISTTTIDLSGYVKSVIINGIAYTDTSGYISLPNIINSIVGETPITNGNSDYVSVSASNSRTNGIQTTTIKSSIKTKEISSASSTSDGIATANDVKNYVEENLTTIRTWTNDDIQTI